MKGYIFDLTAKLRIRVAKKCKLAIRYTLCFLLILNPMLSYSQGNSPDPALQIKTQNDVENSEVLPKIQLGVSDLIPLEELSEEQVAKETTLLTLTPEVFKKIRHNLDESLWNPIKIKGSQIFGYVTVNTPKMLKSLTRALRNPLGSAKNITIITTLLGTASTIATFTFGNVVVNDASLMRLISTGILIICFTGVYRSNFDGIGAFLKYKGWSLKSIKRNVKLQNLYEKNIKNLKNEIPAGLVEETFGYRLLKVGMLELLFLTLVDSWDFIFPRGPITTKFLIDFIVSTVGYTTMTFSDAVLTEKMIDEKINVTSRDPKEIKEEHNKIAFKYKTLSIAVSFVQNLMIIPAIGGSGFFQYAMLSIGGSIISYDFVKTKFFKEENSDKLLCPGVFAK